MVGLDDPRVADAMLKLQGINRFGQEVGRTEVKCLPFRILVPGGCQD